MLDQANIRYRPSVELFLVRGNLVAQQQSMTMPYCKEYYHEVRHFYCPKCGEVWGLRVDPSAPDPHHHFYSSTCKLCGGEENMLNPWEWQNLQVLGENVLAFLFLERSKDVKLEKDNE